MISKHATVVGASLSDHEPDAARGSSTYREAT
jgi:hypothetical protein